MSKPVDIYQSVTDQIIAELEAGVLPWVKEWRAETSTGLPRNAMTGRAYQGINTLILWMTAQKLGYASSRWCTYRQAKQAGGQVRKGEQGCRVIFYKTLYREQTDNSGETATVSLPMRRTFVVFNTDQIDGLAEAAETEERPELERLTDVEALVQASGAELIVGEPAYFPALDKIAMPPLEAFQTQASYYATLLHELTHWVGHPRRLNRDLSSHFGSEAYAAEELIAELGAAFLCAQLGIAGEVRHAGYIEHWLKLMQGDKKAIFTAAAAAAKAAEFLNGLNSRRSHATRTQPTLSESVPA